MGAVLSRADPVARIVSFLASSPAHQTLDCTNVSAKNAPPYPSLVVSDPPGGNAGRGIHLISTVVQIEALGSPDGTTPRMLVKTCALAAIDRLRTLPEQPYDPDQPVITEVTFSTPGWSPLPTGQPRYIFRATVWSHE